MPAMLLLALQLSLLEARISLFRAASASCLSRFPLHRLPLIRERLLRPGAHRRLLEGFRRLAGAPLGVLRGLACLSRFATEEREPLPFADNESQDLLVGRLRAEDDAGGAVPSALDVLRQPDPELAVVIYGQGGRRADLHGWFLLYVGRSTSSRLGFGEYRSYFGGQGAVDDDFDGFVRRGGLAGPCERDDVAGSYGHIRDVYRTILTRDLVQKFSLPDSTVLERLAEYVMDNSGNLDSPNNIADVLDANRVPTNHVTVGRHLSHLRDAFVFYEARRYDIKGKKYLSTQAKHYVCDSGMRYAVLGTRDMDWGRMYENAAFLELMRRGYETYVGKLYQKEVDFVAKRGSELVYIQVSDDISSESTLERELAPLLSVRDAFPKVLIARTRHEPYTREGVLVLDLARWLLGEQGF